MFINRCNNMQVVYFSLILKLFLNFITVVDFERQFVHLYEQVYRTKLINFLQHFVWQIIIIIDYNNISDNCFNLNSAHTLLNIRIFSWYLWLLWNQIWIKKSYSRCKNNSEMKGSKRLRYIVLQTFREHFSFQSS